MKEPKNDLFKLYTKKTSRNSLTLHNYLCCTCIHRFYYLWRSKLRRRQSICEWLWSSCFISYLSHVSTAGNTICNVLNYSVFLLFCDSHESYFEAPYNIVIAVEIWNDWPMACFVAGILLLAINVTQFFIRTTT